MQMEMIMVVALPGALMMTMLMAIVAITSLGTRPNGRRTRSRSRNSLFRRLAVSRPAQGGRAVHESAAVDRPLSPTQPTGALAL